MKKNGLREIIEYFKDNEECPYGINWCENEMIPQYPNSIGTCDRCGRSIRLKTLPQVIRLWISQNLPEEKVCPLHFGRYHSDCHECVVTFNRNDMLAQVKERLL